MTLEPGSDMTKHKDPHDNLHNVCPLSTDSRIFKERTKKIRPTRSAVVRRGEGSRKHLQSFGQKMFGEEIN
jgi:hypothetical protein